MVRVNIQILTSPVSQLSNLLWFCLWLVIFACFCVCVFLRGVSSPTNQDAGCAEGGSGSCKVSEGGAT